MKELAGRRASRTRGVDAMCKIKVRRFLVGLFLTMTLAATAFAQSSSGRPSRTVNRGATIELELLTRAEQRAETLRERLLDLQSREEDLRARLDNIDYQLRPDSIQRALAFVGSVRPMDELRDALRARLENEKARVGKQLELLVSSKDRLEAAIRDADAAVERLRRRVSSDDE
jgi:chaperonin cofactor prefoldin